MDYIQSSNKQADKHGPGQHGFSAGNPAGGVLATFFSPEWADGVQQEHINIIKAGGLVPSGAVLNQAVQAIKRLAGGNVTTVNFASSPFALTADHAGLVLVDATAGNVVLNLPAANVLAALRYTFVRVDATANTVTCNKAGADTIDGAASFTLTTQYDYRSIAASGGTLWLTCATKPPTQTLPAGTSLMWPVPTAPSWALVRDGSAVSRATYAALFAALCPTRNMTTVNAANTLTGLSTTTDLYVGMPVEGAGIPAGTTIASITGTTTATMSANATASATVAVRLFYYGYGSGGSAATFGVPDDRGLFERGLDTSRSYDKSTYTVNITNGSANVTGISSTRGLYYGMPISGSNIPGGATVSNITGATTFSLSVNATATGTVNAVFTGGQIASEKADDFKSHTHSPVTGNNFIGTGPGGSSSVNGAGTDLFFNATTAGAGNSETRPRFRTMLPIIAY